METLQDLINSGDPREIKRAMAVSMELSGIEVKVIKSLLGISNAFVSKWKKCYKKQGVSSLLLHYQGSKTYLEKEQIALVLEFISGHTSITLECLIRHIETTYGIVFKSKQSYYDLLKSGHMSFHKTKKTNPKRDEQQIIDKREEIKKNWTSIVKR